MAKKQINAILWRSYLVATSRALWRETSSQYYIDLPKSDYETFFGSRAAQNTDTDGNLTYTITLKPFEGAPPVGEYDITFKKLRAGTGREGSWNINRQSLEQAYELWQPSRGPLKKFDDMSILEKDSNFLVIVRDIDGRFHGRWIQSSDFRQIPEGIRQIITSAKAGWVAL